MAPVNNNICNGAGDLLPYKISIGVVSGVTLILGIGLIYMIHRRRRTLADMAILNQLIRYVKQELGARDNAVLDLEFVVDAYRTHMIETQKKAENAVFIVGDDSDEEKDIAEETVRMEVSEDKDGGRSEDRDDSIRAQTAGFDKSDLVDVDLGSDSEMEKIEQHVARVVGPPKVRSLTGPRRKG